MSLRKEDILGPSHLIKMFPDHLARRPPFRRVSRIPPGVIIVNHHVFVLLIS